MPLKRAAAQMLDRPGTLIAGPAGKGSLVQGRGPCDGMARPLVIGMSAARDAPGGPGGPGRRCRCVEGARPILKILSALQEDFPVSILLTGSLA